MKKLKEGYMRLNPVTKKALEEAGFKVVTSCIQLASKEKRFLDLIILKKAKHAMKSMEKLKKFEGGKLSPKQEKALKLIKQFVLQFKKRIHFETPEHWIRRQSKKYKKK